MSPRIAWLLTALLLIAAPADAKVTIKVYPLPAGDGPHDVAPAADGGVWYTAQRRGTLGHLDPVSGKVEHVALGQGSAPHGVVVGPDGAAWVTDGGLDAILRVDPATRAVRRFPLPAERRGANLNTAVFDRSGALWFTGQSGIYGRLDPATGALHVWDAPRGAGPYGIAATPRGDIYFVSLAGSYLARVDRANGAVEVIEPPTPRQGARRVWADSQGRLWLTEWNAGGIARYDPQTKAWREWRVPSREPLPYAIYVDERDMVWFSDFGDDAILRFDPASERFERFPSPQRGASVRQLNGRAGEVWAPESATDHLVVFRAER